MRLRTLQLRNYRRHRDTRIEFPDGVLALLGRNGSGKSTLLEAIGFALFGASATRTGKELLRWDGAAPSDPVQVELECELGGQAVRIVRELRGKNLTPQASLEVDGTVVVPTGAGSSDAVTQAVQARLGMDRDGFFTTVVARQKELARLADLGPTERKRLILSMLGVDELERAIRTARGRRSEAETRMETLRGELPDRDALQAAKQAAEQAIQAGKDGVQAAQTTWQQARAALEQASKNLDAAQVAHRTREQAEQAVRDAKRAVAEATRRRSETETAVQDAQQAAAQAEALRPAAAKLPEARAAVDAARLRSEAEARIVRLRKELAAVQVPDAPANDPDTLRKDLDACRAKEAEAAQHLAVVRSQAHALQERLDRVGTLGDEATCPTCEQPLGSHVPTLREHLHAELEGKEKEQVEAETSLAALRNAGQEAEASYRAAEKEARKREAALAEQARITKQLDAESAGLPDGPVPELAALQAAVTAAEKAHTERTRHLARAEALPRLQERLAAAVTDQDTVTRREAEVAAALAALPDTTQGLADAKRAHDESTRAEREAERALLAQQERLRGAQRDRDEAVRRITEADERAARLRAHEEEARYWGALAGGRGRGLLESFKDHLVARIGPAVSREASRLLGRFTGGRYHEVLLDADYQLYVSDGGIHYTLDRFSGGESDLVHLALRLAVSRLLVERSGGAEVRFLALDEVFGSLDDERRRLVLGALQELGGLYSQVLLVTHHDTLRDALDAVLLVEERDGEAVVSVHNG